MTEDRGVRVRDCADYAVGLDRTVQLEAAVNACHNEVEALHHLVGIVERSINQNVGFDALEDPETLAEALVECCFSISSIESPPA